MRAFCLGYVVMASELIETHDVELVSDYLRHLFYLVLVICSEYEFSKHLVLFLSCEP